MKALIRLSTVLGLIIGVFTGIALLIPIIKYFVCFGFIFIGAYTVFYLKKNSFLDFISTQRGIIIGAVSGFTSLMTASLIYLPVSFLLNIFFGPLAKVGFNPTTSFLVTSFNFFVIFILVFFVALLSALFNAFSGFIVVYIYQYLENKL